MRAFKQFLVREPLTTQEREIFLENDMTQRDPIQQFATIAHEEWRKGFDPQYAQTGVPSKQRIKKNSDGTEGDINQPFDKIHPDWKAENLAAGQAALDAVNLHPNDVERASEHVHNEWMKRNPKEDWNASQHVPYSELPESEKQKDRNHVIIMKNILSST